MHRTVAITFVPRTPVMNRILIEDPQMNIAIDLIPTELENA